MLFHSQRQESVLLPVERDGVYSAKGTTSELAQAVRSWCDVTKAWFSGLEKQSQLDCRQNAASGAEALTWPGTMTLADGKQSNVAGRYPQTDHMVTRYPDTRSPALPSPRSRCWMARTIASHRCAKVKARFPLVSSTPGTCEVDAERGTSAHRLSVAFASAMERQHCLWQPRQWRNRRYCRQSGRDGAALEIMLNNTNASVEGQKVELINATALDNIRTKSPPIKKVTRR